jgi:hypothetical protein
MKLQFRDFAPETKETQALIFTTLTTASLQRAVDTANDWIASQNINVINVETVLLPEMHSHGEEGTADTMLQTSGEMSSRWYQFVRVWYVGQ